MESLTATFTELKMDKKLHSILTQLLEDLAAHSAARFPLSLFSQSAAVHCCAPGGEYDQYCDVMYSLSQTMVAQTDDGPDSMPGDRETDDGSSSNEGTADLSF